jgi:hypothetical protein
MVENDVLAIVGSRYFDNDPNSFHIAHSWIRAYVSDMVPDLIVSGDAVGIEEIAAIVATSLDIGFLELLPENDRWEPEGYKDRNIKIVEACTRLVRVEHYLAKTYGSGFTADYAERQRIPVERYQYTGTYEIVRL